MSHSNINDVANYLISECNTSISHRELQKILYFSQGFYIAKYDEALFESNMDAWKYGPVNGIIWERFKIFGNQSLTVSNDASTKTLSVEKKEFLTYIMALFLILGETLLIGMSHTDYPWEKNYITNINQRIEKNEIKEYFQEFKSPEDYISIAKEKVKFSELLENRKKYLTSLKNIGDDWISGGSLAPSEDICTACEKFLYAFKHNLFSRYAIPQIPKLIMGPIPTGGVGIELHLSEKNIYLHFHNNNHIIEVSIESNGVFDEYEIPLDQLSEKVCLFLERVA